MRDVQNPIATTLDNFELVIEAFPQTHCVPVNKVVRYASSSQFSNVVKSHQSNVGLLALTLYSHCKIWRFPALLLSCVSNIDVNS